MRIIKDRYLNNPNLKSIGVEVALTQEQLEEYTKCVDDPVYFANKYVKIITLDKGLTNINLYDFQKETIQKIADNRFVIIKAGRQLGKTVNIVCYLLWFILFNEDKNVAILANKAKTARDILARIKMSYEFLPVWIQQGVKEWNKSSIELENRCKIFADATSSSAARGGSINLLYLDEFAFVPNNIAEEFFTSVYPTITSGTSSKIIISSTPLGMNHFYKMWSEAEKGISGFITVDVNWRNVPGRDEAWAAEQKGILGELLFSQEVECTFLGSSGTLLSGSTLQSFKFEIPISCPLEGLDVYEEPIETNSYVLCADSSKGIGLDYSAFSVIDVTQKPYKVVAKYRNNKISHLLFPNIISQVGRYYNNAYLLIENNDVGGQVADILYHDLEYEHMFFSEEIRGISNIAESSQKRRMYGVRTTTKVKRIGCNTLKSLIEKNELVLKDFDTIQEFSTFILKRNNTYSADDGSHDDMVMTLVLFAWLTTQKFFRELTDVDIRKRLYEEEMDFINNRLVLPVIPNTEEESQFENRFGKFAFATKNEVWFEHKQQEKEYVPFDDF